MRWSPHVTVAAVIRRQSQYLMVEERPDGFPVINQPAGHLEPGERLSDAVVREVLEETAYRFVPVGLVGVYQWTAPDSDRAYLRFCFTGHVDGTAVQGHTRDPVITAVHWMTRDAIAAGQPPTRSPLVLRCIDDAARRRPLPLSALNWLTESQT
jgi:8-oxo-dGTP pyrophosphatase MutT (NUDIX family)